MSDTLQSVWNRNVDQGANDPFLKLPSIDGASLATFKRSSFLSRSLRYTEIFRRELALSKGSRVLLLGVDITELPFMLHGLWLGRFVAVPVEDDVPPEELKRIIDQARIEVVVFPPSSAARVSLLIASVSGVKRWIVTGGGVAPTGGGAVSRLEELLSRVGGVKLEIPMDASGDDEALISFSPRHGRGALFTQRSLIAGTSRWQGTLVDLLPGTLVESTAPARALSSLQFNFILPLLASVVPVVRKEREGGRVWEQMVADSIGCTVFLQDDLFTILRKPKPKALTIPSTSRIVIIASGSLSHDLLRVITEKVGVRALSTYWVLEAGGIIAVSPWDASDEWNRSHRYSRVPPVAGVIGDDVEVKVLDDGAIAVLSPSNAVRYEVNGSGCSTFTSGGGIATGDDGQIVKDGSRTCLAVFGRREERVQRRSGSGYASAVDGVVRLIRGVEWSRTVVIGAGSSLGTYVVTVRMSTLSEDEVLQAVRNSLPEPYWPERIKIVKGGGRDEGHPSDDELCKLF